MSQRVDQVSIQLQRPLAFPDALSGAVGVDLDNAQAQMGNGILGIEAPWCVGSVELPPGHQPLG